MLGSSDAFGWSVMLWCGGVMLLDGVAWCSVYGVVRRFGEMMLQVDE